jgi:benzylsuccinate CoA-transferase BbsF subunit
MTKASAGKMVFKDLKVADFCWVGVGPSVGRMLSEFGATVIRVESETRPDPLRTMPPFKDNIAGLDRSVFYTGMNCNKRSVALDLNNPKAREVAKKLIAWADVMGESFGPGAMEKWGLGYSEVKKINPNILYYSTCMQGQTGPHKKFKGFGLHMAGMSGLYHLLGWPDREPVGPYGAFSDFVAWLWMRTVVLAALDYKKRTGIGQYIDLAQLEATMPFLAPAILEYTANNRDSCCMGNADRYDCPHGVFPCLGEENWIALAVRNEDEWEDFCKAMDNPSWCLDPQFATFPLRKANEEELNKLIGGWTRNFEAFYLMGHLQGHGVGAGVVLKTSQVSQDPQLNQRPSSVELEHQVIGPHGYMKAASVFSKMDSSYWRAAPLLGQDTQWALREVLKLSDKEIDDLIAAGALK